MILDGMDTTANSLARVLQLLADRPEVQDKLRKEILEASKGEDLDYDSLVSLPYLDAVCRETLRLYVRTVFCAVLFGACSSHLATAMLLSHKYSESQSWQSACVRI